MRATPWAFRSPSPSPLSLNKRGSDRSYFRVLWQPTGSAVLVHYDPQRAENAYWAAIALFLDGLGVPVPRVVRHDAEACLVLMEDLGNADLASFAGAGWETRGVLYRKTLSSVHKLHSFPAAEFPHGKVKLMEAFGPDLYRWERGYFMEHFVADVCGIKPAPGACIGNRKRAFRAGRAPRGPAAVPRPQGLTVAERDGQRRRARLYRLSGHALRLRLLRPGIAFVRPLCRYARKRQGRLLSFYYGLSEAGRDRDAFLDAFWEASAQRLMQALGAFGYLGLKKGLAVFLGHIPSGLANLIQASGNCRSLPLLHDLAASCRDALPVTASSTP